MILNKEAVELAMLQPIEVERHEYVLLPWVCFFHGKKQIWGLYPLIAVHETWLDFRGGSLHIDPNPEIPVTIHGRHSDGRYFTANRIDGQWFGLEAARLQKEVTRGNSFL